MIYPYIYSWRNNSKRETLYGRNCRIIQRITGTKDMRIKGNSALVEFENGQREVISRNAIRKVKLP